MPLVALPAGPHASPHSDSPAGRHDWIVACVTLLDTSIAPRFWQRAVLLAIADTFLPASTSFDAPPELGCRWRFGFDYDGKQVAVSADLSSVDAGVTSAWRNTLDYMAASHFRRPPPQASAEQ